MKNIKKLLCAVLTVVMMVSLMSTALATVGPFVDVEDNSPYADYISDLYTRGKVNGIDSTHFGPEKTLNRAQFVTFIGRLAEIDPSQYTECPFVDVDPDIHWWCIGYIAWAYELGITNGMDSTHFNPNGELNRLQMATFMLRFADKYGIKLKKSANPAADLEEIASKWPDSVWKGAETAVKLFGGSSIDLDENGNFNANQLARREEMAKVISMFPVPEGGFVLPEENPPAEGGNVVKINGTDYELRVGDKNSITLTNREGYDVVYYGESVEKIYPEVKDIADDAVVTIVSADRENVITGGQLKRAIFAFYKGENKEAVADERDGVTYIFKLAYPAADGSMNGSPDKWVKEIRIAEPETPIQSGLSVKINGKDYVLEPGSDESFTIIQKEKEVKYDGTAFSNTYGKDVFIPAGIPVTIVCADKEVKIASEQLNLARFVFYKDGKAIEDENDGVTYAFRFAYPGSDGQYVSPEKFVSEINFELPAE